MGTTTFTYDAGGQRVKSEKPDGTIIYTPFPQFEEELRPALSPPPTPTPTQTPTNTPTHTPTNTPTPTSTPLSEPTRCWFNCNSTYSMGGEPMGGGSGYDVIQRSRYMLAGQTIAIRISGDPVSGNNGIFYYLTDHLGSVNVVLYANGSALSRLRYDPWGKECYAQHTTPTGYRPTSQRWDNGLGWA